MTPRLYYIAAAPFEAARRLDGLATGHRASRLHGHSFVARLCAELPAARASFDGAQPDDLRRTLEHAVAPLNYSLLNDTLAAPDDENLARWLAAQLPLQGHCSALHSTRHQGVDLDAEGLAHHWRRYRFEAAHQLPNVPAGHQCGRMHGHGFEVVLHARRDADAPLDADLLDTLWQPLHEQLHCACLNDIAGLEIPTSEMLATWIWDRLAPTLAQLSCVSTYETANAGCHYDGHSHRIWKEQRFEAATRLRQAPIDDPRARLHGHSYVARLHLTAPLDDVMGWTVDYGDVKDVFAPVYRQLDHHNLAELDGDGGVAAIAQWVRARLSNSLPQMDRLDIIQTPGCGCTLNWGSQAPGLPA